MIKMKNNATFRLEPELSERLKHVADNAKVKPSMLIRLALNQALPEWERHGITLGAAPVYVPITLSTQKTVILPVFVGN